MSKSWMRKSKKRPPDRLTKSMGGALGIAVGDPHGVDVSDADPR